MKILKWTLLVVAGLVAVLVGVGLLLPSRYEVQRSTTIAAPPARIYGLLSSPKQWQKWTVWNQRDPSMQIDYSGPDAGAGAKWAWKSKSEGAGEMEFTRVEQDKVVAYALSFPDFGMKSTGELILEPAGAGTKVTWTTRGEVGANPISRYFAAMMDSMVGPDFEKGLSNLKALAEKP